MDRDWVRRDRENGKITKIAKEDAECRVAGYYKNINLAMKLASINNPLTTGFADYYPVVSLIRDGKGKGDRLCQK